VVTLSTPQNESTTISGTRSPEGVSTETEEETARRKRSFLPKRLMSPRGHDSNENPFYNPPISIEPSQEDTHDEKSHKPVQKKN